MHLKVYGVIACLLVLGLLPPCSAYKPIIAMHGFSLDPNVGTAHDWDDIKGWIARLHPGTPFYALALFEGLDSTRPMTEQMPVIQATIEKIVASDPAFKNGYHLLGHSQGGLMMRVMTESIDNHNIDTLVSLAGVQNGVYGVGILDNRFGNLTDIAVTDIFYTELFQKELSIANFWHSPLNNEIPFQKDCAFLPIVNNVVPSPNSGRFKSNFMRLKKAAFLASPDDGLVVPYNSELFGFFATNSEDQLVPVQQQNFYENDSFGLKSMMSDGKVVLKSVPGIQHSMWLHDEQNFLTNVLPLLT